MKKKSSAPTGTRTQTGPILSRLPLPIGLWGPGIILGDSGTMHVIDGASHLSAPRHGKSLTQGTPQPVSDAAPLVSLDSCLYSPSAATD